MYKIILIKALSYELNPKSARTKFLTNPHLVCRLKVNLQGCHIPFWDRVKGPYEFGKIFHIFGE